MYHRPFFLYSARQIKWAAYIFNRHTNILLQVDRKRKSTVEAATGSSDEGEESPPPKKKHVKQQSACVADVKDPPTLSKAKKVIPEKKSQKKQKRSCSTDAQERSSSDRTPVEVYYPESLGYTNARSSSSGAEREEVPLPQARV